MASIFHRIGSKERIILEDWGELRITAQWRKPLSLEEINQMAPTPEVRAREGRP